MYEQSTIGLYRTTLDGKIILANPALVEMLGFSSFDELSARNLSQDGFAVDSSRKEFIEAINATGVLRGVEAAWLRKDGKPIFVRESARLIRDADGNPLYFDGIVEDISAKKQAEIMLHQRADELEALQATILGITSSISLPEVLNLIVEKAARMLKANSGGLYLTEPEQRKVKCVVSYNTVKDFSGTTLNYGEGAAGVVAETGQPLLVNDYEKWSGRASVYSQGRPFHAVLSVPMIWQGQVTGVIHVLRDPGMEKFNQEELSMLALFANHAAVAVENSRLYSAIENELKERKIAEASLLESEERFRKAFYISPDAIILSRLADGVIISVNQGFIDMLGYSETEVVGKSSLTMQMWNDPEDRNRLMVHLLEHGKLENADVRLRRKDGGLVLGLLSAQIADFGGETNVLSITHDITERKQAEVALQAKTRSLEALFSISSQMNLSLTARDMFPRVLQELRQALHSDMGMVILFDQDKRLFTLADADGLSPQLVGREIKLSNGICAHILQTRQTYTSDDFGLEPEKYRLPGLEELGPALFAPIQSHTQFLGILLTARKRGGQTSPYSDDEKRIFNIIGEIFGNAMLRVRVMDQAFERLKHVQTLQKIDQAITSSLDLNLTLRILVSELYNLSDVDAADILLVDPSLVRLEFAAAQGFKSDKVKSASVRIGEHAAGRAALEGRPQIVLNLAHDGRFPPPDYITDEAFVAQYAFPLIYKGKVLGVLETFHRAVPKGGVEMEEMITAMADQAAMAINTAQLVEKLHTVNTDLMLAYDATIEGWSKAIDLRENEPIGHIRRVVELAERLALHLGIEEAKIPHIRHGALLHDIGMMGITDQIFLKPGPLSQDEQSIVRDHPSLAYQILKDIEFLRPAIDIPYCHHERWDGSGYPRGLRNREIPFAARIFAVVDVYDALISNRPFRPGWTSDKALDHIRSQAGSLFDPEVVAAFVDMIAAQA